MTSHQRTCLAALKVLLTLAVIGVLCLIALHYRF